MYRKKKIIAYSVFILFLILLQIFLLLLEHFGKEDTPDFESLTHEILKAELSEDTLSLHYTFANPAAFGFNTDIVNFPVYTPDAPLKNKEKIDTYLHKLQNINSSKLNATDQKTLSLLINYLESERSFLDYYLYEEPLSPSSGIQANLPILLAEYSFYSKKDVDTYLKLLQEIDTYFESLVFFEQQKSQAGLFMSDHSAEQVIAQCHSYFTNEELWKNKHFLQTTFEERILNLKNNGLLNEAEATAYIEQNTRLLLDEVMPAYHSLGDSIYLLLGSGKNDNGLCGFKQGREYYSLLLTSTTGTSKTPQELMTILKERFSTEYSKLIDLSEDILASGNTDIMADTSLDPEFPGITGKTPLENALNMLSDLRLRMQEDFPEISNTELSYDVKEVSPTLSPYCAPAFYLSPPLDNLNNNVIYINQIEDYDTLLLYTTLAHEGFPGHLYQTVYDGIHSEKEKENPISALLYYGGYTEGWALYVENIAYGYAKEFMDNEDYVELCRLSRDIQLCLFSILDMGIHYYNMSYDKVCQMLTAYGIEDEATHQEVYRYIIEEPCNYLKYYVGYLELLECKALAKEYWQDSYSDYEFHKMILEYGPADFNSIKNAIKVTDVHRTFVIF